MKLKQGNIFKDVDSLDYVCITTNSTSKSNGNLVMGAGVAKEADKHNPKLKVEFGKQLRERGLFNKFYGILLAEEKYIAFQTKRDWRKPSDIQDVIRSINMLKRAALKYPNKSFGLPFPAINKGGLQWREVIIYLKDLPDNVTVYHLEDLK